MSISPESISYSPTMIFTMVDLPAPLIPTIDTRSFFVILKDTPFNT